MTMGKNSKEFIDFANDMKKDCTRIFEHYNFACLKEVTL